MITKKRIEQLIEQHEKMSHSYFWNSPRSASQRRAYEQQHSDSETFEWNGKKIEVEQKTQCSCKNIYYKQTIYVDGIKKNVSVLKKILNEINKYNVLENKEVAKDIANQLASIFS